ncbi:MAG: DUF4214 domain-containing protein [Candidatus Competibacterales bacterium]
MAMTIVHHLFAVAISQDTPIVSTNPLRATGALPLAVALLIAGMSASVQAQGPTVQALGDFVMDWNRGQGRDIPTLLGNRLGASVVLNNAVSGATLLDLQESDGEVSLGIPNFYEPGDWDWVVLTGGANDLSMLCNCGTCSETLDRLISVDGTQGIIPTFADRVTRQGSRLLILGYYFVPSATSDEWGVCNDPLTELSIRQQQLARTRGNVYFASGREVINPQDTDLFNADLIHPSPAGGDHLAEWLQAQVGDAPLGPVDCGCLGHTHGVLLKQPMAADFCQTFESVMVALGRLAQAPGADALVGPVVRLYGGVLNRTADTPGLLYWTRRFGLLGDTALVELANAFLASAEAEALFNGAIVDDTAPNFLSDGAFVQQLYATVLGRAADDAGANYWLQQLQTNAFFVNQPTVAQQRSLFVLAFTESGEYRDQQTQAVTRGLADFVDAQYVAACSRS